MKLHVVSFLLVFSPALLASDLCPEAKTTIDTADCLIVKVNEADSELKHYIKVAKERYSYDPAIAKLIDVSQIEWE